MVTRTTRKASPATPVTDEQAAFEATRDAGLSLLRASGRLAANAGEAVAAANSKRASALDGAIAGLCTPGVMTMEFTYDIHDKGGNVIEHCRASLVDYVAGFKNTNGTDSRDKQSAFRATMLPLFFGVTGDQSSGAKATWALFTTKALPAALALTGEGMTATIDGEGKLTVIGGTGEDAETLRNAAAKSTSALVKAAKGETGTNRSTPQNDKGEGETRAATPAEIAIAAYGIAKRIAKGEEAVSNSVLSTLRELAKLVAANPDAFAED